MLMCFNGSAVDSGKTTLFRLKSFSQNLNNEYNRLGLNENQIAVFDPKMQICH